MDSNLGANIRLLRKQQNLTQQQLADAMRVTVGAIHKWEQGLSTPDIRVIMDLARFFGTSLDAMAGYQMEIKEKSRILRELNNIRLQKTFRSNWERLEFWLRLYPNDYDIVLLCGEIFQLAGAETQEEAQLTRAIALLQHAADLSTSQTATMEIHQKIGFCYLGLGLHDRGIAELQAYNPFGVHNDTIGMEFSEDPACRTQALSCLSKATLSAILSLTHIGFGYLQIFFRESRYDEALSILQLLIRFEEILEGEQAPSFLTKDRAVFLAMEAAAKNFLGNRQSSHASLLKAAEAAMAFDQAPDYTTRNIPLCNAMEPVSTFDGSGPTAWEAVAHTLQDMKSPCIENWEKLRNEA